MSIDIAKVFELIARRPRIRTIEIADIIDCEPEQVQPLLQPYINARTILLHLVTAPNGKPANGFEFSDAGKRTNEYRSVAHLTAPGVGIDGPPVSSPAAPAQLMAVEVTQGVDIAAEVQVRIRSVTLAPLPPTSAQKASEALQALAKFPPTKVEIGIAFIKALGKMRALVVPRAVTGPAPVFRCARWSDGTMEIERDGVSLAILSGPETESMRHFMGGH